jgi:hypothetical protein
VRTKALKQHTLGSSRQSAIEDQICQQENIMNTPRLKRSGALAAEKYQESRDKSVVRIWRSHHQVLESYFLLNQGGKDGKQMFLYNKKSSYFFLSKSPTKR